MRAYAEMRGCRDARSADYFGERGGARHCGACDTRVGDGLAEEPVPVDAVIAALAAVARFSGRVGLANVAGVLGGRKTKWSTAQSWVQELPFHGALKSWSDERVRQLLAELVGAGLARQSSGEYPVVELTAAGREAVRNAAPPLLKLPAEAPTHSRRATTHGDAPVELVDRLRRWRLETARTTGVPAYVVFHSSTLSAIAAASTSHMAEILRVSGVGDSKLRKYGEEVLEVLAGASKPED